MSTESVLKYEEVTAENHSSLLALISQDECSEQLDVIPQMTFRVVNIRKK